MLFRTFAHNRVRMLSFNKVSLLLQYHFEIVHETCEVHSGFKLCALRCCVKFSHKRFAYQHSRVNYESADHLWKAEIPTLSIQLQSAKSQLVFVAVIKTTRLDEITRHDLAAFKVPYYTLFQIGRTKYIQYSGHFTHCIQFPKKSKSMALKNEGRFLLALLKKMLVVI